MVSPEDFDTPAKNEEAYVAQWKLFARRQHLALFLIYGWIPVCAGLFLLSRFWLHQPEIGLALMFLWFVGLGASVWWAGEFRCPRCSRRYASLGSGRSLSLTRGIFDKVCPNCKLAKFEQ